MTRPKPLITKKIGMKLFPLFKKEYILGLDIGTSSIKSALLRKQPDGLRLVKIRAAEITREKQAVSALKEALSGIDIKNCEVITALNSSQVMVKRIAAPPMPYAELKEALSLEVKNYFPFPVTGSLVDFEIIGEAMEKGIKKTELLLGVCPQALIHEHFNLLTQAGIRPSRAINSGLALYNLLKLKGFKDGLSVAALDMGKSFCDLIIVRDKRLVFSRKIPICGDDFTRAATSALFSAGGKVQLTFEEAEKVKKARGLILESGQELIENKITPAQFFSLLRPQGERLANEIERSFDFYREESGVKKVDKLILFGGGARLKGLDQFLSESLGAIEVEVFSYLEGLKLEELTVDSITEINLAAVAIGAGLGGASGINLLPFELKQEMKKAVQRAAIKAGLSAAATIMLLVYAGMRIQLAALQKKISAARFELSALEQSFGSPEDWGLMHEIIKYEPYYEDVLREIGSVIPNTIYLKEMKMERRSLELSGVILSAGNPEEALSGFIHSLEAGIFKNVRFSRIDNAPSSKEFSLRMEIE